MLQAGVAVRRDDDQIGVQSGRRLGYFLKGFAYSDVSMRLPNRWRDLRRHRMQSPPQSALDLRVGREMCQAGWRLKLHIKHMNEVQGGAKLRCERASVLQRLE